MIISRMCELNEVILSDCHENVLRLLRENVQLNGCEEKIKVLNLDWDDTSALDELERSDEDIDVTLAADVVYDDTIFKPLVNVLLSLWRRNTKMQIFLAATVRNEETLKGFLSLVIENGLTWTQVSSSGEVKNLLHWDDTTEIKLFLIEGGRLEE